MTAARQWGPLVVLALAWAVLASCGGREAETVTVAEAGTESTAATTAPTTTATAPETTTTARSEWCLERDAGKWTETEVEEYDPSPLNAEKAETQRRLDRTLANETQQANTLYDNLLEVHADDPARQADLQESRQSLLRTIRAQHDNAVDQVNSRYVRLHREAKARHDARQMDLAELAELELRNELQRYELECQ